MQYSNNIAKISDLSPIVTVCFVCLLTLFGLWTRISGLGDRIFAEDEYYFIRSIQNILEFGFPRFSSGGYYIRGLLLQYLTAISIIIFGEGGFAYRLPAALFGVGTLVMAYFLGRQFLNRSWSIVLVAILTFSSWEIEFSRFARMYSAFQFAAICFFWSLYRYSFDEKSKKRYFAVAFAMLAILTAELGVFVAIFLFLPMVAWLNQGWRKTIKEQCLYIAISLMVLVMGLFQATYNFRLVGVANPLPHDFVKPLAKDPHWLSFGMGLFGDQGFLAIGLLAAACLAGGYAMYIFRNRINAFHGESLLGGLLVLAVCCAIFHQFAICAVIMLVIALREAKLLSKRPFIYYLILLALIIAFWLGLLFFAQGGIDTSGGGNIVRTYLRSIRTAFFAFPDLYFPVVNAWAENMPVLGFFLGIAIAWQLFTIRRLSLSCIVRNPVIPIVIVVLAIGFHPPSLIRTRYSQFLYSLALCVGLLGASQAGEFLKRGIIRSENFSKISVLASCLLIFTLSEDFNAFHLSHLNSDTVEFRIGRYEKYFRHWYQRRDFQRPAELVNAAASDGSRIIITSAVNTAAAYLKPEFAVYWPRENCEFESISREGGTKELWSGSQLLSTVQDVVEYTRKANSVWVIDLDRSDALKFELNPEVLWPDRVQSIVVFKPGRDKRIAVWKIELRETMQNCSSV